MEIGTGLFTCQRRPDDDRSFAAIYDEMLTLAGAIEDAGLASAWVSEHHFLTDGYLSATMPALGALAAATSDIEIGTCIALAPLYDQVRLAEDTATVDLIADGRLTLGLAIGSNPREFDQFGIPRDERVARLTDTVNVLRAAWSPGPLEYDPEFHPISPDATVMPKPDSSIPIMLGGGAKPAVRRAARTADGWCAPSSLGVDDVRVRSDDIRAVRSDEGINGEFTTYVIQHGFVGDSRQDAWESMRDGYLWLQRRYQEIFSGTEGVQLSSDRRAALKEQAIFGTADQVIEQLATYEEALGENVHFILRTYHPGIGTQRMVECIERLGNEVVPHFE